MAKCWFLFRWSTVSVKVTLEDINDHVPIFDEQIYVVTATEGATVNSTILTVKVSVVNVNTCPKQSMEKLELEMNFYPVQSASHLALF